MPGAVRYRLKVWWDPLPDWQRIGGDNITATTYTHTGLTAGRKYYYTVQAVNAAGDRSDWQQDFAIATVPTAPATGRPTPTPTPTPTVSTSPLPSPTSTPTPTPAPAGAPLTPPALTAQARPGAVVLRWDPVPGAVRYDLMVWWDPLPDWQPLGGDNITATTYTHTGLTAGREYYYTVQAVNAAGEESGWQQGFASAVVPTGPVPPTPTPTPTQPPGASPFPSPSPTLTPTATPALTATATPTPTPTSAPADSPLTPPALTAEPAILAVVLRWDPVPGAVRYELMVWWDPLPDWQPLGGDNITATTYTHTGLTAGRQYYYTVQAVNAAGEESGWQQDYAFAVVLDEPPPPPPQEVQPPPASLGLDPYYRKYLDAGGIPVVASAGVDDAELYHASDIILAMLSERPDLLAAMVANRFRVIVYEDDGCRGPYQVPELRDDLPPGRCSSAVGIASIKGIANRFTGEVLLVIEAVGVAPAILPYCNFVLVHEFAHLVDYTISLQLPGPSVYDPGFEPRVRSAYNAALAAGLYRNAYAATNPREYWAEAVTFWFLPDMLTGLVRTPAHVATLADYDPRIVSLVEEVFRDAALPDCNPVFFRLLGTVTGPEGDPLSGITVLTELRVVPEISPYFWYFTEETLPTQAGGAFVLTVSKPKLARARRVVRQETGETNLDSHLILGVAPAYAGACPAGYLSGDTFKVENISPRAAARLPIPGRELPGISLTLAPNFDWTQQICRASAAPLPKDQD